MTHHSKDSKGSKEGSQHTLLWSNKKNYLPVIVNTPLLSGTLYNQLQVPTTESAILICSENEEGKYMFAKSVGRLSTDRQLCCYMNDVTLVSGHMVVRFAGKHSLRRVVCTDI